MKELKFNLKYLFNKKELYFGIIGILLINSIHLFLVIQSDNYYELMPRGEYQFILYNTTVTLNILVIVATPILCSMILSDSCWLDRKRKIDNVLYMRLDYRKLIFTRWLSSIIIAFILIFLGFMLNYISCIALFGSGNDSTSFQGLAYNMIGVEDFFLDTIRMTNPVLFIIAISLHVSFIFSLLSGISFLLSFFTKQRLVVYFQILLFMIVFEAIFSFLGVNGLSIIKQLQPFSRFTFMDASILYIALLLINMILIAIILRKKDTML